MVIFVNFAEKYFNMPISNRINVFIEDGKDYVLSCKKKYDIIFADMFGSWGDIKEGTSKSMKDVEVMKDDADDFHNNLKRIITDNGYIVINSFVTKRNYDKHMEMLNKHYSKIIESYVKLGKYSNNHIVFCTKK